MRCTSDVFPTPESPTTNTRTCPHNGAKICSLFSLSRSLQNFIFFLCCLITRWKKKKESNTVQSSLIVQPKSRRRRSFQKHSWQPSDSSQWKSFMISITETNQNPRKSIWPLISSPLNLTESIKKIAKIDRKKQRIYDDYSRGFQINYQRNQASLKKIYPPQESIK
uniref:Uncharacterized protein n=2 Tax=Noccaea caerulescens TaxID=107243 RepID=A0A1J3FRT5_NOCCA